MAFDTNRNTRTDAAVLSLEEIAVVYPDGTEALSPTSLALAADEVTVLLGPSGAGKSTLLRTLNRLVAPAAGRLSSRAEGEIVRPAAIRRHRRDTAMIFQQHQLIHRLTALQNVLMGRLGRHPAWRTLAPLPEADRRLALACLDRVGLFEKALTRCDSLSGGQQQRVGIARALCQQPRMVLADEPVASLDPASSRRVLTLLRDICRQDGIPVVISLHQLEYAREFADRVVGLAGGRVVFDAAPSRLDDAALRAIYDA
jgi:phosphonate transport system ATP-binding protein